MIETSFFYLLAVVMQNSLGMSTPPSLDSWTEIHFKTIVCRFFHILHVQSLPNICVEVSNKTLADEPYPLIESISKFK